MNAKQIASVLKTAQFPASGMREDEDHVHRMHEGYDVQSQPGDHFLVRFETGVEGYGKRTKELQPRVEKNIAEYEEILGASNYLVERSADRFGFPTILVLEYTGVELAEEPEIDPTDKAAKQKAYRQMYNAKKKAAKASGATPGSPGIGPARPNKAAGPTPTASGDAFDGGVGSRIVMVGGHNRYKGKAGVIKAINERGTAEVELDNGTVLTARLTSLASEGGTGLAGAQPIQRPTQPDEPADGEEVIETEPEPTEEGSEPAAETEPETVVAVGSEEWDNHPTVQANAASWEGVGEPDADGEFLGTDEAEDETEDEEAE
jgi:hypothetical protein